MDLNIDPSNAFVNSVIEFSEFGTKTLLEPFEWEVDGKKGTTMKAINEYWTSRQRQAHSLHEISYRACYKPQLPRFFIERLSEPGDAVYDPFMGRGINPLVSSCLLQHIRRTVHTAYITYNMRNKQHTEPAFLEYNVIPPHHLLPHHLLPYRLSPTPALFFFPPLNLLSSSQVLCAP